MSRFGNSKKDSFLAAIPVASFDSDEDRHTKKCKFNFSYFEKQDESQDFSDWNYDQLIKLFNKLKDYSREPLSHWKSMPIGKKSGNVLSVYGAFPKKSALNIPKHVPHQAQWGRFRLESAVRLVGFVVPDSYNDKSHAKTGLRYDCNTFYIVFLDANHKFYCSESK